VTPGDADDFILWLRREGYAEATIGKRIRRCQQFFRAACRKKLIGDNPFEGIKAPSMENEAKFRFVSREETTKLMAEATDAQLRLIVALSRYGGLRCPSETLKLKWSDVDFTRKRIRVHSPKTEHHKGKESREIPLFPELRPYLEEAFDPEEVYVAGRYHDCTGGQLRMKLMRMIKRAGLKPWPRVFHNLRASRQNELAEKFAIHLVCRWIGNSALIASKHYLNARDEDFEKAAAEEVVEKAAQKTTRARTESKEFERIPAHTLCEKPLISQQNCEKGPLLYDSHAGTL
jgi:integrase